MTLRVGVIIPAYNAEAFIEHTLDSVAAQSRKADQVAVVDDGSTDGTAGRIEAWIATHPATPVLLIRVSPNRGLSLARNSAVVALDADCVATLDADDLLEPDHLRRLMEPLEREAEVILAFGDSREFSSAGSAAETLLSRVGTSMRSLPSEDRETYQVLGGSVFRSLLQGSYVPVSGCVFRRRGAIEAGLWDPGLKRAEDRDFMLRMARAGKFAFVSEVVCRKRVHAGNISGPTQQLPMSEGAFGTLLRARELVRQGSVDDRVAVDRELRRAAEAMLYFASITSLDDLARVAATLRRSGFRAMSCAPRAWMRAVWYGLTGQANRVG